MLVVLVVKNNRTFTYRQLEKVENIFNWDRVRMTYTDLCLAHPLESVTPFDVVVNSIYTLLTMPVTYKSTNIIASPSIWYSGTSVALYHTSTYILTYCIDASVSAGFFFVSEHPKREKTGGLGLNKRNRGIQRLLNSSSALLGNFRKSHFFCLEQKLTPLL